MLASTGLDSLTVVEATTTRSRSGTTSMCLAAVPDGGEGGVPVRLGGPPLVPVVLHLRVVGRYVGLGGFGESRRRHDLRVVPTAFVEVQLTEREHVAGGQLHGAVAEMSPL